MRKIVDSEKIKEILGKYTDKEVEETITDTLSNAAPKQRFEILTEIQQKVPKDFWIILAVTYLDTLSRKHQNVICNQLEIMFKENSLVSKKSAVKIFRFLEDKIISHGLFGTQIAKVFQSMVKFVCRSCKDDKRYRLFDNYGHVYYTTDIEKLKSAVIELNELYEKGGSPEAVRSYAYLLTVAQFRLARLLYPKDTISKYNLSEAYNNCFDNYNESWNLDESCDDGWRPLNSFGNNNNYISNVPERITHCGCIEIARIFNPHLYYIDAELLQEIHRTVREVSDRNRYENEIAPIVAKNCLFVINPDN